MSLNTTAVSLTMAGYNLNNILARVGLCLCFALLINAAIDPKCPGPLAYYKALECTPIFKIPQAVCPEEYNCDYLKSLRADRCYVNNHTYEIGEKLKDEDANPCDISCTCSQGADGISAFNCAIVDCFHTQVKPGCFLKNSPTQCCPGEEVCPENPKDRAICNVDGKEYKDGEYFTDATDPDKNCVCQPGYTGENVEPFCVKPKHPYCSPLFRHASDIAQNCAPVYYSTQAPQTSCSVFSRCQNDKDVVIRNTPSDAPDTTSDTSDSDMQCTFGNLTMNLGDELNQATDYSSVCVKCVCEVPPIPTCQRLPDEECDITKQPNFNTY